MSACLLATAGSASGVSAADIRVDCKVDSGALAPALAAASDGDRLLIRGTCVGSFRTPAIDLTLQGRGSRPTIRGLSGDYALEARGHLVIRRLTIERGRGLIGTDGLTVIDSIIQDSERGGVSAVDGRVVLRRSTIRRNAGVGVFGRVTIDSSTIRDNGGLGIDTGGTSTISRSVIRRNGAGGMLTGTSLSFGLRGDVRVRDSRITANGGSGIRNYTTLTVEDSLIRDNTASGGDGPWAGLGGGIYNEYVGGQRSQGRLTLIRSRVTRNSATDGGGIYSTDPSVITLDCSLVRHNTPNDCTGC